MVAGCDKCPVRVWDDDIYDNYSTGRKTASPV